MGGGGETEDGTIYIYRHTVYDFFNLRVHIGTITEVCCDCSLTVDQVAGCQVGTIGTSPSYPTRSSSTSDRVPDMRSYSPAGAVWSCGAE